MNDKISNPDQLSTVGATGITPSGGATPLAPLAAWTNLGLAANWVNAVPAYSSVGPNFQYLIDTQGVVHLRGAIAWNNLVNSSSAVQVFTNGVLPGAIIPAKTARFTVPGLDAGAANWINAALTIIGSDSGFAGLAIIDPRAFGGGQFGLGDMFHFDIQYETN